MSGIPDDLMELLSTLSHDELAALVDGLPPELVPVLAESFTGQDTTTIPTR